MTTPSPLSFGLLALAVVLVISVLTNQNVPLLANDRVAYLLLFVVGIAMCSTGAATLFERGGADGVRLAGTIGAVIIGMLSVMVLFGWTAPFASLASIAPNTRSLADAGDRGAFILLTALVATKVIIGYAYRVAA